MERQCTDAYGDKEASKTKRRRGGGNRVVTIVTDRAMLEIMGAPEEEDPCGGSSIKNK